jgi:transposase
MRPHGTAPQLEARRRKAIALLQSGETYQRTSEKVGASLSSVVRWHQAYRKGGWRGLRSRPAPGRPSRLSAQEKKRLTRHLLKGPIAAGYATDVWTLPRIVRAIERLCGVRYTRAGAWFLLRRDLGWSSQKPERRAFQRDETAIERWKRNTWPRIKKSRSSGRQPRVPRRERVPAHP